MGPSAIDVEISGGLGNRLFQLALGLACARVRAPGTTLVTFRHADVPTAHSRDVYGGLVARFTAACNAPCQQQQQREQQQQERGEDSYDLYFTEAPSEPRTYNPAALEAARELPPHGAALLFRGYFQSPRYSAPCAQEVDALVADWLRAEAGSGVDAWCARNHVDPAHAAFVHVRLGDYVGGLDLPCGDRADRFFAAALAHLAPRMRSSNNNNTNTTRSATCALVLSDAPLEVRSAHPCIHAALAAAGIRTVDVNAEELNEVQSMHLMARCTLGGVIPGSTFSWWGAHLACTTHTTHTTHTTRNSHNHTPFVAYIPDPWSLLDAQAGLLDDLHLIQQSPVRRQAGL
jgi:hypothetical protein